MKVDKILKMFAQLSVEKASRVLEKLVRNEAKIVLQDTYAADISQVTAKINEIDSKIIGAFVDIEGDINFKFLFYMEERDALSLTDLMLRRSVGTTTEFNKYVYSAVKEMGNILSSAVAAAFAADFDVSLRPCPPDLLHDFGGTVFEEYIMRSTPEADTILIIESIFKVVGTDMRCTMYIIPGDGSDKILHYLVAAE